MTFSADPYRTLGLVPGAPVDEVKRAYRRLAKRYHPDSAGELEVRRFLAIQAAYEQIVGGRAFPAGRPARPQDPWGADPSRARATRQGQRARSGTRTGWSSKGWSGGSWWSSGRPTGSAGTGPTAAAGGSAPGGRAGASEGRAGSRRKATMNSTSYDEAGQEPFEPSWEGAGWYGASSGTYWTINPKEYADPRKHGPEYQARARRASEGPGRPGEAGPFPGEGWAAGPMPGATARPGPSSADAPADAPAAAPTDAPRPDVAASAGLLAGLLTAVVSALVLLGGGAAADDLLLPALLAPLVVGIAAAATVRVAGPR
jgi:hypothetical protein